MSDDDDTGGGKKHSKLVAAATQVVTDNKWTVAIAVVSFVLGYWVG